VLLAEYGSEPIRVAAHDILFSMLTHTRLRTRLKGSHIADTFRASITLDIHDALAAHIEARWEQVGSHLFRWHKDQMCRHAATVVRLGGYARPALAEWLRLHDVDEEEYSLETAYKLWQRFGWNFSGAKKPDFFARTSGKPGAQVGKNRRPHPNPVFTVPPRDIEAAAARLEETAAACLRAVPKSLRRHAHLYYYTVAQGLSQRVAAARLGIRRESVRYACRTLRNWSDTDPAFSRMLAACSPASGSAS